MSFFAFLDGGERSPNNILYYTGENLTFTLGGNYSPSFPIITTTNNQYYFQFGTYASSLVSSGYYPFNWAPTGLSSNTIYFGARLYTGTLYNSGLYFSNSNNNIQIFINFNRNGSISATSGGGNVQVGNFVNGANLIASSNSFIINQNTVIYFETYIKVGSNNTGAIIVRINGNPTPVINVSNVNTVTDTSSLPITVVQGLTNSGMLIRDLYIMDGTGASPYNTFLGDVTCQYQPPTANVTANFTPVGNTFNYQNAAETPPVPTTYYNTGANVNNADTFTITPLSSDTSTVLAVKLFD